MEAVLGSRCGCGVCARSRLSVTFFLAHTHAPILTFKGKKEKKHNAAAFG